MKRESLIVKFFENTLSEEERLEFETLMDSDEEFKKEVAFREELASVITLDDREAIKQELQALEQPTIQRKSWLLPIAASLVVLLGISSFWFFGNQTASPEDLFNTHFEPYRNIVEPIVRGDANESIEVKAFAAYEQKDYGLALSYLNVLLKEDSNNNTLRFYKANVLLQLNKGKEAADIFKENLKLSDTLLEKNQWYLALSYIKLNQFDLAKQQLDELIKNPKSDYKKKEATFLLKKLK